MFKVVLKRVPFTAIFKGRQNTNGKIFLKTTTSATARLRAWFHGVKAMAYTLLSDCVIIIHFLWVVFILFGFIISLRLRWIAFIHVAGLVFTLILNLKGWYCPLTYLENYLHRLSDSRLPYGGSFIAYYLGKLIYLELDGIYLRIGAIAWVILNMCGYAVQAKKKVRPGT